MNPSGDPGVKHVMFLDDDPARQLWASRRLAKGSTVLCRVETAEEAIEVLGCTIDNDPGEDPDPAFDTVYLDHDLGGEVYVDSSRPDTGMAVVRWVCENRPPVGEFVVHTMNTPAGNEMTAKLREAGYLARYVWFPGLVRGHE